ncbi:hypothetical protein EJ04DRAFT_65423, partial [Polyplosphaeria fusca]
MVTGSQTSSQASLAMMTDGSWATSSSSAALRAMTAHGSLAAVSALAMTSGMESFTSSIETSVASFADLAALAMVGRSQSFTVLGSMASSLRSSPEDSHPCQTGRAIAEAANTATATAKRMLKGCRRRLQY